MSKILAYAVKALAEGKFGEAPKKLYWWLAGKKMVTAAILGGAAALLKWGSESGTCGQFGFDCSAWTNTLGGVAAFLLMVGLYDGALRTDAPNKYAGLVVLLCLLAGSASAATVSAPNWMAVHVGAWLALVALVGMLIAFLIQVGQGKARLRDGFGIYATLALVGVLVFNSSCASAQLETFPRRPQGVDQGVVDGLVCRGQVEKAEYYAQDRGASRAEVTERISRAIEAAYRHPATCCLVNGCADAPKQSSEDSETRHTRLLAELAEGK